MESVARREGEGLREERWVRPQELRFSGIVKQEVEKGGRNLERGAGKIPLFLEINNLEMLGDAPKKSGGKKRDRRLRWSHPILAYIWLTTWPEGQAAPPQVTPAPGGQAYIPVAVRTGSCPPPPNPTGPLSSHKASKELETNLSVLLALKRAVSGRQQRHWG